MSQPAAPSPQRRGTYSKVFSAGFGGAFLALSGALGYDLSGRLTTADGGRWADGPIWVQVVLGFWLLLIAIYWTRQIRQLERPSQTGTPTMKNVGRGTTSGSRPHQGDLTKGSDSDR
jgi:hypothetical protein